MENTPDGKPPLSDLTLKRCGGCLKVYSVAQVLDDPAFRPLGLQAGAPGSSLAGVYFFHDAGCEGTLLVPLDDLRPFLPDSVPPAPTNLGEVCSTHCQDLRRHRPCWSHCDFAPFFRLILGRKGIRHESERAFVARRHAVVEG